jgi:HEPN domain-containing protein/flagellar biosynthesis/type III secretory pathway protein FliH/predicted nucleotidyltransferase
MTARKDREPMQVASCLRAFALKTTLENLPAPKREQVEAARALIQSRAEMEMLVLFGSHTRSDWAEDLESGYLSDLDFLAVVEWPDQTNAPWWAALQKELVTLFEGTRISLLVEDIRHVNQQIRRGQFFYADLVNDGVLLIGSQRYEFAKPKARNPEEYFEKTLKYFDYWFRSASECWHGAVYYAARNQYCPAAFCLHQAAEQYLHGALLVYQGYKPKSHDLKELSNQTAKYHPAFAEALPRTASEDAHHFDLLRRAYIEARYSASFRVTTAELTAIREMVLDLAERTRTACASQLRKASPDGELPTLAPLPDVNDSFTFPEPGDLTDPNTLKIWRAAITTQAFQKGHEEGKQEGLIEGLRRGRDEGRAEGIALGKNEGLVEGLSRGRTEGREEGLREGIERGVELGREEGRHVGLVEGLERGRNVGRLEGLARGRTEGREEGRHVGLVEGLERGRNVGRLEERARAVVEVLRRRGVAATHEQEERLMTCRDEGTLEGWWERAWEVSTVDELWK